MGKHRKIWKSSEKRKIVAEVQEKGLTPTIRKYEISAQTYYNWRNRIAEEDGAAASESLNNPSPQSSGVETKAKKKIVRLSGKERTELKQLRKENKQLKRLVAEKELTILLKDELLKKKS